MKIKTLVEYIRNIIHKLGNHKQKAKKRYDINKGRLQERKNSGIFFSEPIVELISNNTL